MTVVLDLLRGFAGLFLMLPGLAGYGRAVLAAAGIGTGAGLQIATGVGVYLALCGLLELFSIAGRPVFAGFLALGWLLWLPAVPGALGALRRIRPSFGAAALALIGALLMANACIWYFGNFDDVQGYLVFYERILQTGAEGADPFSYRRFESGLGGGVYLYALSVLSPDVPAIRVVDVGGGLVTLAALLAEDLPPARRLLAGAVLLAVVAFVPAVNMTPEIFCIAMFYAMIRFALRPDVGGRVSRPLLLALYVFALACLKTTLLIPALAVVAAVYLPALRRRGFLPTLGEVVLLGACALLLMLPWMIVSERGAGTPLFPLLGVGRLSPVEVSGHAALADFVKAAGRIAVLLVLPVWVTLRLGRAGGLRTDPVRVLLPLLCGAAMLLVQTRYTVAGYRYGFSGAAALLLAYLPLWLALPAGRRERLAVACCLVLVVADVGSYFALAPGYRADAFSRGFLYRRVFSGEDNAAAEAELRADAEALRKMQAAVPEREKILVRVDAPYLLDFRRNPVEVMDWPGMTGPPPGPPQTGAAADWAAYLAAAGVRYVAYSYADQAGMVLPAQPQVDGTPSAWQRLLLTRTRAVQAMLSGLPSRAHVVFDDGRAYVADLGP